MRAGTAAPGDSSHPNEAVLGSGCPLVAILTWQSCCLVQLVAESTPLAWSVRGKDCDQSGSIDFAAWVLQLLHDA